MKFLNWFQKKPTSNSRSLALNTFGESSKTLSGVSVTKDSSLSISAVYSATRVVSEAVAQLPLVLYRRTPDGKIRAVNNPLYALLHDAPNDNMTSYKFRETMQSNVSLHGNAYAEIVRDADTNMPLALNPIQPDRVEVGVSAMGDTFYMVDSKTTILRDDMLHISGLSWDGLKGISVVSLARQSFGLSIAAEEHGACIFGNGAFPGGVIEYPGELQDDAMNNLRKSWESMFKNRGTSRVAILEHGVTFKPLSMPNDDTQWLGTRQFQIAEVARWFKVPPHMIGDLTRSSFSNIESQQASFYQDSLLPHLVNWEQEINRKLLNNTDLFVEFLVDGMLRADTATRYAAYAIARQNGWMSVNDIRTKESMNRIEGGDIYLQPLNMVAVNTPLQSDSLDVKIISDAIMENSIATPDLVELRKLAKENNIPFEKLLPLWDVNHEETSIVDDLKQRIALLESNNNNSNQFAEMVERILK